MLVRARHPHALSQVVLAIAAAAPTVDRYLALSDVVEYASRLPLSRRRELLEIGARSIGNKIAWATRPACTLESHERAKLNERAWTALHCIGYLEMPACEDEPAERLELRNCLCGSTLARTVAAPATTAS